MSEGRPCLICGTHYGACTNEQMAAEQLAAAEAAASQPPAPPSPDPSP